VLRALLNLCSRTDVPVVESFDEPDRRHDGTKGVGHEGHEGHEVKTK